MKYNLLNNLKEYKKLLEDKFGLNSINTEKNNLHNKLDTNNSISAYLRERLGNLIYDSEEFEEYDDNTAYHLIDLENNEKMYSIVYDKKECELSILPKQPDYDSTTYDQHILLGDSTGILYIKIAKNYDYLLLESIKFGEKTDIERIKSAYYDEIAAKYIVKLLIEAENLSNFLKNIIKGNEIIPEIEVHSIIDYFNVESNEEVYIEKEIIFYKNRIRAKKLIDTECYKQSEDFIVANHFEIINKNRQLILDSLNISNKVNYSTKIKKKRKKEIYKKL